MLKVAYLGHPLLAQLGEFGIAGEEGESPKVPEFRKIRGPWQGHPQSGKIHTCRFRGPASPSLQSL